jgi:hypothetical protein
VKLVVVSYLLITDPEYCFFLNSKQFFQNLFALMAQHSKYRYRVLNLRQYSFSIHLTRDCLFKSNKWPDLDADGVLSGGMDAGPGVLARHRVHLCVHLLHLQDLVIPGQTILYNLPTGTLSSILKI